MCVPISTALSVEGQASVSCSASLYLLCCLIKLTTPLKKTDSLHSVQQWPSIVRQIGVRTCVTYPYLYWCVGWPDLVQVLWRQPRLLWVHKCIVPVLSRRHCFTDQLSLTFDSQLFCSWSLMTLPKGWEIQKQHSASAQPSVTQASHCHHTHD